MILVKFRNSCRSLSFYSVFSEIKKSFYDIFESSVKASDIISKLTIVSVKRNMYKFYSDFFDFGSKLLISKTCSVSDYPCFESVLVDQPDYLKNMWMNSRFSTSQNYTIVSRSFERSKSVFDFLKVHHLTERRIGTINTIVITYSVNLKISDISHYL